MFRVEEVGDFLACFVAPDLCLPQWWELLDRDLVVQVAGVPAVFCGDQPSGVQLELQGIDRFSARKFEPLRSMGGESVECSEEHALAVAYDDRVVGVGD